AYLALAVASEKDLGVAAVVELYGGLHEDLWEGCKHLPPLLIIHGTRDRIVPVKEAYALRGLCDALKVRYEMVIYEGQDHLFRGGPITSKVIEDAGRRTLAFLRKSLRPERPAVAGK